jgi:DNA-directed RNA polymerase specialized sigma24 family protein
MSATSEQADALREVVALARRHGLSAEDIAAALGESRPSTREAESHWRGAIVRVLGYLGGTFIGAGIGVFVGAI